MPLTEKQKQILYGSFLLKGIDEAIANESALFNLLEAAVFDSGESIYTPNSFRREIGIITRGSAIVRNAAGVELNLLHEGGCFGVAALWSNEPEYVSSIEAKTACEVVFLSQAQLERLFLEHPKAAVNYIGFLSDRIHFLNRRIDSFTAPSAHAVLCMYLSQHEESGRVEMDSGYSALARSLNLGRASLYRALEKLEEQGAISREGRIIHIRDASCLHLQEK